MEKQVHGCKYTKSGMAPASFLPSMRMDQFFLPNLCFVCVRFVCVRAGLLRLWVLSHDLQLTPAGRLLSL